MDRWCKDRRLHTLLHYSPPNVPNFVPITKPYDVR
jgi:hypothetical protein